MKKNKNSLLYTPARIKGVLKIILAAMLVVMIHLLPSCKKFLDIPLPKDKLVTETVFADDNSATSAIVGIYSDMMQTYRFVSSYITWYGGLSSDELRFPASNNPIYNQFANNAILPDNMDLNNCWSQGYQYIYDANISIDGLERSSGISMAARNQLTGEAKFIRAFNYFYLVNLFGDVPLVTGTDYKVNARLPRTSKTVIYQQIISDLKDAQNLLSADYVTEERARPNKWTATALLARAYLYTADYAGAERESGSVINSGTYHLPALNEVFLKSSEETIWQLRPVNSFNNTLVALRLVPFNSASSPGFPLTEDLYQSFESGDQRKNEWTTSRVAAGLTYHCFYKYKIQSGSNPLNEYFIVFRLAEQYLIRSEARAMQNNGNGAADLNEVRSRAGLGSLPATTPQNIMLEAIARERRSELFGEWADRWLDLKRTGRIDAVMSAFKPSLWKPTAALWPVPLMQLNTNPTLVQNPGY